MLMYREGKIIASVQNVSVSRNGTYFKKKVLEVLLGKGYIFKFMPITLSGLKHSQNAHSGTHL